MKAARLESFPLQRFEIADVSPVEGTIAVGNYWFFFTSPRNGIEEADGSIPFSSTTRELRVVLRTEQGGD